MLKLLILRNGCNMISHDNKTTPKLETFWDTSDREFVWFGWSQSLRGSSIVSSDWVVPANWTIHAEQTNVSVIDDDGTTHTNSCGVLLSTTETKGTFLIKNKIVLADGREYERSVKVKVKQM